MTGLSATREASAEKRSTARARVLPASESQPVRLSTNQIVNPSDGDDAETDQEAPNRGESARMLDSSLRRLSLVLRSSVSHS